MKKLKLYWSNICVLSKAEDAFLVRIANELKKYDIELEIMYFGLGQKYRMAEYMKMDETIPDFIVSSDLEVFEDERIYTRLEPKLKAIRDTFPLKDDVYAKAITRDEKLLPYLGIPLVFHSNTLTSPLSLESVAKDGLSFAFGGIDNSAGKTLVKAIWDHFGQENAEKLFSNAFVAPMPIGAYNASKTNMKEVSISPLLFPLSGNVGNVFAPTEGALAVPSYVAVSEAVDDETTSLVLSKLLAKDFADFYVTKGYMYCAIEGSEENVWLKENCNGFFTVRNEWLKTIPSADFHAFYKKMIPSANC